MTPEILFFLCVILRLFLVALGIFIYGTITNARVARANDKMLREGLEKIRREQQATRDAS